MNEFLAFAGDVKIEDITIYSIPSKNQLNITNQVIGIQIFEDIFSPFISGNIVIQESIDILNNLPITGQELLNISIKTPTLDKKDSIKGQFFVYKMSDRIFTAEKNVMYTLHFISYDSMRDARTRLSRTYEGRVSEIAKSIIAENYGEEKIGLIEDTKNNTKFVSNYWTPYKCVNYVANNAVSMTDSPTYMFFQNRNGYNFVSLETLYDKDAVQSFNYNMTTRTINATGDAQRNIIVDYQRVNEITLPNAFDTVGRMMKGAYGSTLYTYDVLLKRNKKLEFNYQDSFEKHNHLNKYPLTSKGASGIFDSGTTLMEENIHTGVFTNYGDVSNVKTMQLRNSMITQVEGFKVIITVPGRTDYTVGQKVKLAVIQPEPIVDTDTVQDELDKTFSGNYLIGAINHGISRERHECTIELIKDSMMKNIDKFNESN